MNQAIKNLKYENLIFFDLEMASQYKDLRDNERMLEVFRYKKRNKDTEELLSIEDTVALYDRDAALNPVFGKICCATLGLVDVKNNKIRLTSFKGAEDSIINGVVSTLNLASKRRVVGFNSTAFDLCYLRKRHNILGLENYPEYLNDVGKKSWDMDKVTTDIMSQFKGSGFMTDGLDELCMAFGVPSPKITGVKGSQVSKVYWEGDVDRIVTYCEADVFSTINLFRRMRNEPLIESYEISK